MYSQLHKNKLTSLQGEEVYHLGTPFKTFGYEVMSAFQKEMGFRKTIIQNFTISQNKTFERVYKFKTFFQTFLYYARLNRYADFK